uniref:Uncharacterized protein n=1 Tax=Monodon monoceros TaxID=40151 RepID=A0A8C6BKT8_MONMO
MATRARERPWARRQGSAPPPLPSHSVPSEGLSFPTSTVPGLDVLPAERAFQLGVPAPTSSRHLCLRPPTLPDEEGAQDEDDETHNARCIPPLGLVALGACQDRPIAKEGQQVGVAFPVWGWEHGHPQPTQARSPRRKTRPLLTGDVG